MTRYTLDAETGRQLGEAVQAVELCDDSGRVIWFFLPEGNHRGVPPAGPPIRFTDAEIVQRRAHRSGRTLDDILQGLDEP